MVPSRYRSPSATPRVSVSLSTKTTTMAAPAKLASQNPRLGRSWAISAAAATVASGMMPSTTPPCAAGTFTMASAISTGKPTMVQSPASTSSPQSARGGSGLRVTASSASPASPAMVARAALRNSGSIEATVSRVAGSVPPNNATPAKPSANPSFSRGVSDMRERQPSARKPRAKIGGGPAVLPPSPRLTYQPACKPGSVWPAA